MAARGSHLKDAEAKLAAAKQKEELIKKAQKDMKNQRQIIELQQSINEFTQQYEDEQTEVLNSYLNPKVPEKDENQVKDQPQANEEKKEEEVK